jgi:hypothetical protein
MTLTASETCYHCLHADFKAEANGTMRGFARCTKAKTAEDKASYYFGGYRLVTVGRDVLADVPRKRLFRLSVAGIGVHLVLDGAGVLGSVSACSHGHGHSADSVILVPLGWQ